VRYRRVAAIGLPVLTLTVFAALTFHAQVPASANPRVVTTFGPETFTSRVVTDSLAGPWEVSWGPDGYLWITERTGKRVVRVNPTDGSRSIAVTIDDVYQTLSQDGLLGLVLHPDLLKQKGADYAYVAYTYDADPGSGVDLRMKVRRYTYDRATQRLSAPADILTRLPHGTDHGGGRMVFGPDGKLYLSRGDHGSNFLSNYCNPNHAQDLPTASAVKAQDWTLYQGKILRLNPDGSIPKDNPFPRSYVWSYGHRNPQGLAFQPETGRLFETEHGTGSGNSGNNEVNIIEAGKNYGWPAVVGNESHEGFTAPLVVYDDNPPAGATFVTSDKYPTLRGTLLIGTLGSQRLLSIVFKPGNTPEVLRTDVLFEKTFGRIRDVVEGPDGFLYFSTSNRDGRNGKSHSGDDQVYRLLPPATPTTPTP
jgi:PQQ-dependent dehydrogenase (s-GDH family)